MTGWQKLAGGSPMGCQTPHTRHASQIVAVILRGPTAVPDFPPIPDRLSCAWNMRVWDTGQYMGQHGIYCTGQDETSLSIASQGIWEGYETVLALELLETEQGVVVDIGAHVGWYTLLAAVNGRHVVAVEADLENIRLLEANTDGLDVEIVHGWVGVRTLPIDIPGQVRLLKADIEGLEREAIRVVGQMLRKQTIDWLMLEMTPAFPGSDCGGIVETLNAYGYDTFLVPTKGTPIETSVLDAAFRSPISPEAAAGLPEQRTLLAGVLK